MMCLLVFQLSGYVKDYSTQASAFLLDIPHQMENEQGHDRLPPGGGLKEQDKNSFTNIYIIIL